MRCVIADAKAIIDDTNCVRERSAAGHNQYTWPQPSQRAEIAAERSTADFDDRMDHARASSRATAAAGAHSAAAAPRSSASGMTRRPAR